MAFGIAPYLQVIGVFLKDCRVDCFQRILAEFGLYMVFHDLQIPNLGIIFQIKLASWNEKESVRIIGTLFVLARRINTGCLTCPHFRHTYFSGINTAAKIIESEGFMNLLKSERDFLLNALDWDAHKEYAFLSCGCSLTAMCDWWNQPYFRGNALQTFKRVASIQTDIFKKKVEIEKGKDTN